MIAWLVMVALDVGLVVVAVRSARRDRPRARLRRLALAYLALLVASSVVGVAIGVRAAFSAVGGEAVDPSQKARVLGQGIAEAMNGTAFGVGSFFIPMVVAFVLFLRSPKG